MKLKKRSNVGQISLVLTAAAVSAFFMGGCATTQDSMDKEMAERIELPASASAPVVIETNLEEFDASRIQSVTLGLEDLGINIHMEHVKDSVWQAEISPNVLSALSTTRKAGETYEANFKITTETSSEESEISEQPVEIMISATPSG